ncbi:type II toxin-antitoxin system HicB family antitoxin [Streptomyces sp. NPDC006527]|uniref:type II toxin-antitoxin system HicB family antitoxin n=1 Tax=Streptomyces sp. NPDC006527 TaxID=3364749 RepID=UPI003687D0AB
MSHSYEVTLRRTGRWWAADVPVLGLHTQGRTLDEAEALARDLVARATGAPPDAIVLDLVAPELASLLGSVTQARRRRAEAAATERRAVADAVRTLVDDLRVSQGDAGRLLGLSPEQVSRLAPPRGAAATRPAPLAPPPAPPTRRPDGGPGWGATPPAGARRQTTRQAPAGRRPDGSP